jgi:hypothetical protein
MIINKTEGIKGEVKMIRCFCGLLMIFAIADTLEAMEGSIDYKKLRKKMTEMSSCTSFGLDLLQKLENVVEEAKRDPAVGEKELSILNRFLIEVMHEFLENAESDEFEKTKNYRIKINETPKTETLKVKKNIFSALFKRKKEESSEKEEEPSEYVSVFLWNELIEQAKQGSGCTLRNDKLSFNSLYDAVVCYTNLTNKRKEMHKDLAFKSFSKGSKPVDQKKE